MSGKPEWLTDEAAADDEVEFWEKVEYLYGDLWDFDREDWLRRERAQQRDLTECYIDYLLPLTREEARDALQDCAQLAQEAWDNDWLHHEARSRRAIHEVFERIAANVDDYLPLDDEEEDDD